MELPAFSFHVWDPCLRDRIFGHLAEDDAEVVLALSEREAFSSQRAMFVGLSAQKGEEPASLSVEEARCRRRQGHQDLEIGTRACRV